MPQLLPAMKDIKNDFRFLELADSNHKLYLSLQQGNFISIKAEISRLMSLPEAYDIIRVDDLSLSYGNHITSSHYNPPLSQVDSCTDLGYLTEIPRKAFLIALVSHAEEKVIYYNLFQALLDVALNCRFVTQTLLWKNNDYRYRDMGITGGLPEIVFFDYLLNNYNVIISDNNQTYYGQRFWEACLLRAIDDNALYAYIYEQLYAKLIPLTRELFESKKVEIWGESDDFATILAIISKSDLIKLL